MPDGVAAFEKAVDRLVRDGTWAQDPTPIGPTTAPTGFRFRRRHGEFDDGVALWVEGEAMASRWIGGRIARTHAGPAEDVVDAVLSWPLPPAPASDGSPGHPLDRAPFRGPLRWPDRDQERWPG